MLTNEAGTIAYAGCDPRAPDAAMEASTRGRVSLVSNNNFHSIKTLASKPLVVA
jgi:hypothetical protein